VQVGLEQKEFKCVILYRTEIDYQHTHLAAKNSPVFFFSTIVKNSIHG
jgi:hypothetical protein